MGAKERLLPPLLPFMFFAAGIFFHVALWVTIIWVAGDIPAFSGKSGPVLTAIHILTLGVLVMTVMGASFQLLPIATGKAHRNLPLAWMTWWLYVPGLLMLLHGFSIGDIDTANTGGMLISLSLLIFIGLIADLLRRTSTLRLPLAFAWTGLASLLGTFVLGLALLFDFALGFLPNHGLVATAHMIMAGYGFMGMMVLGFSNILVPMFSLSPPPPAGIGWTSLALALLAILGGLGGTVTEQPLIISAAATIGLAAATTHIAGMLWVLSRGMRKNLGISFIMIKIAWAMLPLSLMLAVALGLGLLGERGPALFGFTLLFGWLLTFLLGTLQRIIPFLAAMNMSKHGIKPPRISELARAWTLKAHTICHVIALTLIMIGIFFDAPVFIRIGAASGFIGAFCFAWFSFSILKSYLSYQHPPDGKNFMHKTGSDGAAALEITANQTIR